MGKVKIRAKKHKNSALIFVLKGLIPYTRENLMLSFKPNSFFNELEAISGYSKKTISTTYYRAVKQGFIQANSSPILTELGKKKISPFVAKKLKGNSGLMVIFDIPREQNSVRRQFRNLLKEWGFVKIQHSVWMTNYDHEKSVQLAIKELGLNECVQLYEAIKL